MAAASRVSIKTRKQLEANGEQIEEISIRIDNVLENQKRIEHKVDQLLAALAPSQSETEIKTAVSQKRRTKK